jgi:hypothetical protein
MSNPEYAQPATGYGMQRTTGGDTSTQQGSGTSASMGGVGSATGYGMERTDNAGSERTAAYESQFVQHMNTADAVNAAALAIQRSQEGQLARIVDALVDILNPEYRSRAFPLISTTAANIGTQTLVWELPLDGQWTLDKMQLLTLNGADYPDYVRVDIPDVGTPLYLTSALTMIEPRLLTYGNQRVTINSVSASAKSGVLLITYRRLLHIARRRQWEGEF